MIRNRRTYKDKKVKIYLFFFTVSIVSIVPLSMLCTVYKLLFIPLTIIMLIITIILLISMFRYISDYHYFLLPKKKNEIIEKSKCYDGAPQKMLIDKMIQSYKVSGRINEDAIKHIMEAYQLSPETNMVGYILSMLHYYSSFDKYAFIGNRAFLNNLSLRMMELCNSDKAKEILSYYLSNDLDECINIIYNYSYSETGLYKYESELFNNIMFITDLIDKDEYDKYYDKSYIYDEYRHKRCVIKQENDKYIVICEKFFDGWYNIKNNKEYTSREEAMKHVNYYFKK